MEEKESLYGHIVAKDGREYPIFLLGRDEYYEKNRYLKCYGNYCHTEDMRKISCKMKVCVHTRKPVDSFTHICINCAYHMRKCK